jgi:hypothetical protein
MDMPEATSHTQTRTSSSTYTPEENKRIAKRPLTWYDGGKYAFISIAPEIIERLGLKRHDIFEQVLTEDGILLRRLRNTPT